MCAGRRVDGTIFPELERVCRKIDKNDVLNEGGSFQYDLGSAWQHQTHDTKSKQNEFFHRSPLSGISGLDGRIYMDRGSFL